MPALCSWGLWGGVGDEEERARRALVRVQGLLGGESVQVGVLSGGRGPSERITLLPLGDERVAAHDPTAPPWPGRLPQPSPGSIFVDNPKVWLEDVAGNAVYVTERGVFSSQPGRLKWGEQGMGSAGMGRALAGGRAMVGRSLGAHGRAGSGAVGGIAGVADDL